MLHSDEHTLTCQLERTKPTVENVTPLALHQQTQPRIKGVALDRQNELPILYGGGRELLVGLIPPPGEPLLLGRVEVADFFVLSTCMVVWINAQEIGLQIPYQKVVYHGTRLIEDQRPNAAGSSMEIVLTVQRDATLDQLFPRSVDSTEWSAEYPLETVELVLRPQYGEFERVYNEEREALFTFREFGLNRGDRMVSNCNAAISRCMDLFCTDEDQGDDPDEPVGGGGGGGGGGLLQSDAAAVYANFGAADDLDVDSDIGALKDDGVDAGMALEFYDDVPLAGRRHMWDSGLHEEVKKPRSCM
ncbi:LAFA_0G11562g1_1 [Lachancea sp. 'fantastica']|nr:LAFA_0G11562g1_1 [Lachancea sp. 'fantastica']